MANKPQRTISALTGDRSAQVSLAKSIANKTKKKVVPKKAQPKSTKSRATTDSGTIMIAQPAAQAAIMGSDAITTNMAMTKFPAQGTLEIYPASGWQVGGGTNPLNEVRYNTYYINPISPLFPKGAEISKNFSGYRVKDLYVSYVPAVGSTATGTMYIAATNDKVVPSAFTQATEPTAMKQFEFSAQWDIKTSFFYQIPFNPTKNLKISGDVNTEADYFSTYCSAFRLMVAGLGGSVTQTSKVGDFKFVAEFELNNLGPTIELRSLDLDILAGASGTLSDATLTGSSIGAWWKKSRDGSSYYWTSGPAWFNFAFYINLNADLDAGTTYLQVIDQLGAPVPFAIVDYYLLSQTTGLGYVNNNVAFATGKVRLPTYCRLTDVNPLPPGSRVTVEFTPTDPPVDLELF